MGSSQRSQVAVHEYGAAIVSLGKRGKVCYGKPQMPAPENRSAGILDGNYRIAFMEGFRNAEIYITVLIAYAVQHFTLCRGGSGSVTCPKKVSRSDFRSAYGFADACKRSSSITSYGSLELIVSGTGNYVAVGCFLCTQVCVCQRSLIPNRTDRHSGHHIYVRPASIFFIH